jgi:hypothetical protein
VLAEVFLFQVLKHLREPECNYKFPGFRDLQGREEGKAGL